MPPTGPSSEGFGWARFYEEPEAYWVAQQEVLRQARAEAEELQARRDVCALLAHLRSRGLLREDRLSYTRICQLEHETGVYAVSWLEYYNALREAQQKDEER